MNAQGRGNPYKFGLIGASDTHVGAGAFDEDNYWSKIGLVRFQQQIARLGAARQAEQRWQPV